MHRCFLNIEWEVIWNNANPLSIGIKRAPFLEEEVPPKTGNLMASNIIYELIPRWMGHEEYVVFCHLNTMDPDFKGAFLNA